MNKPMISSHRLTWIHTSNSLPNDKFLDCSKLKTFADDKINLAEKLKFVSGKVENIVGKGENAGYQHFSPFSTMFSKGFYQSRHCVVNSQSRRYIEPSPYFSRQSAA